MDDQPADNLVDYWSRFGLIPGWKYTRLSGSYLVGQGSPTQDILDEYKKNAGEWNAYADKFLKLMIKRQIENTDRQQLDGSCLLCSEDKPHHCHRRLVAEYLRDNWSDVEIIHL